MIELVWKKKEKIRDVEYKKATTQYISALKKELDALERNNGNYDRRNQSFKEEVKGIQERCKIGAYNLVKSQERLKNEREKMNQYLLDTYPRLASQVREDLIREKEELEQRIRIAKDVNEKFNSGEEVQGDYIDGIVQVKEKRLELEKQIMDKRKALSMGAPSAYYETNVHFLNRFIETNHRKDDKSLLNEYVNKPELEEIMYPKQVFESMKAITPKYLRESVGSSSGNQQLSSYLPRTDLLSNFYYKIPPTIPGKTTNVNAYPKGSPEYTSKERTSLISLNFSPI